MQRQVPQRHVELPATRHIDRVTEEPGAMPRQAPPIQKEWKTVEPPRSLRIGTVVEAPLTSHQPGVQARRVPDSLDRALLCTVMTFIDEQIANSLVPMTQARLVEVVASVPELLALSVEENQVEVPDPPIQEQIAGAACRRSRLADSGKWRRRWRGFPRIGRGATLSGSGRRFGLAGQQQPW